MSYPSSKGQFRQGVFPDLFFLKNNFGKVGHAWETLLPDRKVSAPETAIFPPFGLMGQPQARKRPVACSKYSAKPLLPSGWHQHRFCR
jgi:hypothetical protein